MGAQLGHVDQVGEHERVAHAIEAQAPRLPSLDEETAQLVRASIAEVATMGDDPKLLAALGCAEQRHLIAPREVRAMLATRDLDEWDSEFVASVARDGRLLWSRWRPPRLPTALSPVAQRVAASDHTKRRRQPTSHM